MKEIFHERGGKALLVPTDRWLENEKIKQKLADLGYW